MVVTSVVVVVNITIVATADVFNVVVVVVDVVIVADVFFCCYRF